MARFVLIAFAALLPCAAAAELRLAASAELLAVDGGPSPSFMDGSLGKLRYGENDSGLELTTAYVQVSGSVVPELDATLALDLNTQADDEVGISEATLVYRPLPVLGVRPRLKIGAFRPPVSLEHSGSGWATLYTTNASAINSWVGEELGGLGAEVSVRSDPAADPYGPYWSLGTAAFYGNDPAGTLLSWRGWSVNNWQTRWGDTIALADLPVIDFVPGQAYHAEPFLELDDRAGYYVDGEVGRTDAWRLRALHYDNRADPTVRSQGQIGWRTQFDSFGVAGSLPGGVGLVAQWLAGRTYAGPHVFPGRPLDNDFDAQFLLLTRVWGGHRVSVRREWFAVHDQDASAIDDNDEDGDAWTVSYQHRFDDHWLAGLEWLRIDSRRPARATQNEDVSLIEDSVMAVLRWSH